MGELINEVFEEGRADGVLLVVSKIEHIILTAPSDEKLVAIERLLKELKAKYSEK